MVIEDGRSAVYVNACSRIDLNVVAFIDESGYDDYDVWRGANPEMGGRYYSHARCVKRFDYDRDLKFISDVER